MINSNNYICYLKNQNNQIVIGREGWGLTTLETVSDKLTFELKSEYPEVQTRRRSGRRTERSVGVT